MPKILDKPREGILAAAKSELAEKGVEGFNVRDVAKISGVSIGTIYNYFDNKFTLVNKVVEEDWNRRRADCEKFIASPLTVDQVIEGVYELVLGFSADNRAILTALNDGNDIMVIGGSEQHNRFRKDVSDLLNEGLSSLDKHLNDEELTFIGENILYCAIRREVSIALVKRAVNCLIASH